MQARIYNGTYKIVPLTSKTLKEAATLAKSISLKDEVVFKAFDVPNNPKSVNELSGMFEEATYDGISLIAKDIATEKIIGVIINKFVVRNKENLFEKYLKICKEEESQACLQFLVEQTKKFNIFDYHPNDDCGVEFMFVASIAHYRKLGLAHNLLKSGIELAKMLAKGENVRVPVYDRELNLEHVAPTFGYGIQTRASSWIDNVGFTVLEKVNYNNYFYKGQTLDNKIGQKTEQIICENCKKCHDNLPN